jgi:putative molybdopterin biosynthesis protein
VYLDMKSLEEARGLFLSRFGGDHHIGSLEIGVEEALGRVTAEPVFARMSVPTYHAAAMDGVAVRAEETYGTTERLPKILKLEDDARWINTGQVIPRGYNAVIMVENLHQADETHLEIRSSAFPWQNVRKVGEDVVATQILLHQNHRIRPYDLGAILAAGVFSVKVRKRPRVAIIPTGSELLDYRQSPSPGQLGEGKIIESNSLVLSALIQQSYAVSKLYPIVVDQKDVIRETIQKAVDSDAHLILVNAGSSAGSKDYTADIISELGEVLVHGVAMMPGKPTILGEIGGKPIMGIPGYAVSAILSFEQFVRPLLHRWQGMAIPEPKTMTVFPSRNIPSRLGIEEFLRVNIGKVGKKQVAIPLPRAASSIMSLARAEGIIRIPAFSEGIGQDETVEAELLVEEAELQKTVVIIGSHDMTLDLLADELRQQGKDVRLSSGNVGSLGGLLALRKGICHMAGAHLLDPARREYNLSYIDRYLKGTKVSIFHHVLRDQGLIVARSNPKGIKGIGDLMRKDVVFVNRQAGSGTRVLFDHLLQEKGIQSEQISGYDHEEYTHMAVSVDVLSGVADCGMGVLAAAKALDLDFIPIAQEQYDIIVPTQYRNDVQIENVLETMKSPHYRDRVSALGGYDPSQSGVFWMDKG